MIQILSIGYEPLMDPHNILMCRYGKILEDRGFLVSFEQRIYPPDYLINPLTDEEQEHFRIDVYGERGDGEVLMYEVGYCKQYKLNWLRKHVGKVIHVPFLTQWTPPAINLYIRELYRKYDESINLIDNKEVDWR